MQEKQEKGIMTGLAILGCLLIGYGMIVKNNVVFVIGLVGVVIAYLMFRRRLVRRKNTGVRSQNSEDRSEE